MLKHLRPTVIKQFGRFRNRHWKSADPLESHFILKSNFSLKTQPIRKEYVDEDSRTLLKVNLWQIIGFKQYFWPPCKAFRHPDLWLHSFLHEWRASNAKSESFRILCLHASRDKGKFSEGIRIVSDDWPLRSYGVTRDYPGHLSASQVLLCPFVVIWSARACPRVQYSFSSGSIW